MAVALIIVDVQNDFCEGGPLPVPGASEIIEPINKYMKSQKWDLIVATKDWHPPNHISFAVNHPGSKVLDSYELVSPDSSKSTTSIMWPVHCVQNTEGAELCSTLDLSKVNFIVAKGETSEFYSSFSDILQIEDTKLHEILQKHQITEIVVVGLAFDYCVGNTALDGARLGYKTIVLESLTRSISAESSLAMKRALVDAGVVLK